MYWFLNWISSGIVLHHLAFGILLLAFLQLSYPAYAAFKKRRSAYGIVFNRETDIPEALVSVSLRDLHGRIVRTAVTDNDGKYKILAPKGEYFVEARKQGFVFPSTLVGKQAEHHIFDNILPSTHIVIKDYGVMTKNIPIDPVDGQGNNSRWFWRLRLPKGFQYFLGFLGPVIAFSVLNVWFWRSPVAWVLFLVYFIHVIDRVASFKPPEPPYGVIRDAVHKQPIEKAIVRVFDSRFNKLLETQITSRKGRYAFVVNRGQYRIRIEKTGYKTVVINYPKVTTDMFLLAKNVVLKPLGMHPTDA
ncbi:carboxypeptidase regulatory-like domain-containing protein [Candidatus Uhrbacteria bacterium]|nr:carboxypeptidase regulatory-like domain-containing protein [Candidatus Uhrbacteria bacterium]